MIRFNRPTIEKKDLKSVLYCMITDDLLYGAYHREFSGLLGKVLALPHVLLFSSYLFPFETLFALLKESGGGRSDGRNVVLPGVAPGRILRAVEKAGLKPLLVDIEENSLLPDPDRCRAAITERTLCLILPQMCGIPHDMTGFRDLGVPLVEDLDGTLGARIAGKSIGSFGHFVTMSLDDDSLVTTGAGGMLASRDRRVRSSSSVLWSDERGVDLLMSDFNASLGLSQLKKLDALREARHRIGQFYDEAVMSSGSTLVGREDDQEICYSRYVVRTDTPFPEVERFFRKEGLPVRRAIEPPLHRLMDLDPAGFPHTERACSSLVRLPLYPGMSRESVEGVARAIRSIL
jgi:perosamine synthetase